MPDGAFVYALFAGDLTVAFAQNQIGVHAAPLDLRQRIEGVPQTKEQLLAIHEFLGAGLVQAGGIFDPIVTIQGIISLVVARPFRMGGFAPPAGHELLGHFVRNLCVFIVGVPRVKVFQIDGRHL